MRRPQVECRILLLLVALACFGMLTNGFGISPPPDGGYPGGNTAEGQNALFSLTTGGYNTAAGFFALRSDTTGSFNTGFGAGALFANNADQNCAFGVLALFANTGPGNSAFGYSALMSNTANANAAFGAYSLLSNTSGNFNTASGFAALQSNTTGTQNTAVGSGALLLNTTGNSNTAVGVNALLNNADDPPNSTSNTAMGVNALSANTEGGYNTAIGASALRDNVNGNYNTALGYYSGAGNSSGVLNVYIGDGGAGVVNGESNTIRIGDWLNTVACYIGGIKGFQVDPSTAAPVYVDGNSKLGTIVSSKRFKDAIRPMNRTSEAILALKPVTFYYKTDAKRTPCFGLIAEDVAEVDPDLVIYDRDGKPSSVRYDQVNAMLLNEFLKEHRRLETLQAAAARQESDFESRLAQQEKQIQSLTAALQKVGTAIELGRPKRRITASH